MSRRNPRKQRRPIHDAHITPTADESIRALTRKDLLALPHVLVPQAVLRDPTITHSEHVVLIGLLALANGRRSCSVTLSVLAVVVGLGKQAVGRALVGLEKKGRVEVAPCVRVVAAAEFPSSCPPWGAPHMGARRTGNATL